MPEEFVKGLILARNINLISPGLAFASFKYVYE